MEIDSIHLRKIELPLKVPFVTHQATLEKRPLIIVEVKDTGGRTGYGEVTAFPHPFYTYETIATAWHVLEEQLIPIVLRNEIDHPVEFPKLNKSIQGHPMAKAGLEGALWDLYGKQQQKSLSELLGGVRKSVAAGAVLSLTDSLEEDVGLLKKEGFQRFKLKVVKGNEIEAIQAVKTIDPYLPIMIDANGQYTESDMGHLHTLDKLGLTMIEQPFQAGDFYLHRRLQRAISTPVCLDESVMSVHDAQQALELESCQIINIKISRVGGMTAAQMIHDYCQERGVPVWCGGMVESGISKAHNLAVASLPNFSIPGDLSGSGRYFHKDIIHPEIVMNRGEIAVPQEPGIGVEVDDDYLEEVTQKSRTFHR
ncbi:o-succinylbenzoate synthase [Halobacillus karajensis]|uniref:o-succinylbenzoate synthase n=1 Tax=Halobacillus karajensis TaxID=195088 RepID=A0A024P9C3_9BACI|nr:o-succinylbenzoate synthase [Halobacillus karajensis]CDQ21383.1 o-succinylbenzoate synthase [Halobacillus karajensis]CDQ25545.1 o-succinylbenzoate synthase [Halobacillus karajensis]CDQ25816.1 o-succinylbenzoate synthase [Halobacillus karajensis]